MGMSNESKFTPGPWSRWKSGNTVTNTDGDVMAVVYPDAGPRMDGNVHLIAAAPELYAALKAIVNGTGTEGELAQAERALAKADGR